MGGEDRRHVWGRSADHHCRPSLHLLFGCPPWWCVQRFRNAPFFPALVSLLSSPLLLFCDRHWELPVCLPTGTEDGRESGVGSWTSCRGQVGWATWVKLQQDGKGQTVAFGWCHSPPSWCVQVCVWVHVGVVLQALCLSLSGSLGIIQCWGLLGGIPCMGLTRSLVPSHSSQWSFPHESLPWSPQCKMTLTLSLWCLTPLWLSPWCMRSVFVHCCAGTIRVTGDLFRRRWTSRPD